jgi:uncharacterized protein (TIGR02117 family)
VAKNRRPGSLGAKLAKAVALAIAVPLALACLYIGTAFVLVLFPANAESPAAPAEVEAFVIRYGVHADFVFPAKSADMDWQGMFPLADFARVPDGADYVAVGWGDREFYLHTREWKDLTAGRALGALAGLHGALLHVTYLRKTDFLDYAYALPLSKAQYAKLIAYILASAPAHNGRLTRVPGAYTAQDAFYEASGAYNLFQTCNSWIGAGLLDAGVKVSRWTPFDRLVVWYLPKAAPPA